MNLRWNGTYRRFEAEFSTDFQGDLVAVKAAGFKTDGPPEWVWYSYKAEPLTKLRENRPQSGLTITPDAREQFAALTAVEAKNAEIKAQLAAHNKELKKKLKIISNEKTSILKMCAEGYMCISVEDLPPKPPYQNAKAPPWTGPVCVVCSSPLLSFERHNPNVCTWCEKIVLDNATEVC